MDCLDFVVVYDSSSFVEKVFVVEEVSAKPLFFIAGRSPSFRPGLMQSCMTKFRRSG